MPIQEAKFAELITLVTNYSCGEDNCAKDSGSFPLKWEEYREPGTQFIKAATSAASIADELRKVYLMSKEEIKDRGIISREWAYKNYSIESTCKKIEKFIDEECNKKFDYKEIVSPKYPYAAIPKIEDNATWIKTLYSNILNCQVNDDDEGLSHWVDRLNKGENRQSVENFFRKVALKEEQKKSPNKTLELLKSIKEKKADKVVVLTARGHTKPIAQFLKSQGITSGITIAALGDSDPMEKARYIEKHIKNGYTRIAFVDDAPKNVKAVKTLMDKYPQTNVASV